MKNLMFTMGFVAALMLTICDNLPNICIVCTAALACLLMGGSYLYA